MFQLGRGLGGLEQTMELLANAFHLVLHQFLFISIRHHILCDQTPHYNPLVSAKQGSACNAPLGGLGDWLQLADLMQYIDATT